MKKKLITLIGLCWISFGVFNFSNRINAQSNIIKMEYYLDNDPGYGLATNMSIAPSTYLSNQVISIDPANLSIGLHSMGIRAKDASNNWSLDQTILIFKPSSPASTSLPLISKLEYYVDSDPGLGNAIDISITSSIDISNIVIPIDPTSLSNGLHIISVRAKDMNQTWSLSSTMLFYKPETISTVTSSLSKMEYFIDTDPGYSNATNIPITSSMNISNTVIPIDPNTLGIGLHTFNIRTMNSYGNWSLTQTKLFYKPTSNLVQVSSNINRLEYFIDTDPGYGLATNVNILSTSDLSNIAIPIPMNNLSIGLHRFCIRAKDALGRWSLMNDTAFTITMDSISLKLFIEGYYEGSGIMKPCLVNESISTSTLNCDTIQVELHEAYAPYNIVKSITLLLKTNGTCTLKFPSYFRDQPYYLVAKHRNSISTWSAWPIALNSISAYDFSTSSNKAYGDNEIEVEPGIYAFYSGDVNQDDNIDLIDLSLIENDINNFESGYFATDINGDGNVDLLDISLPEINSSNFIFSMHP